jgi:hypothetical protein
LTVDGHVGSAATTSASAAADLIFAVERERMLDHHAATCAERKTFEVLFLG